MPGPLLHLGATVTCLHAGQATPTSPNPRVLVGGQAVVTLASPYMVSGCTLPPPPSGNGPCVSAQFVTSASRVLASGTPVLLADSQAVCTPSGTGVVVVATQVRVTGT